MVKWLQNKNRTDPPKITIETLKDAQDQSKNPFLKVYLLRHSKCQEPVGPCKTLV